MNNNSQLKSVSVDIGMQFFPLCVMYRRKNNDLYFERTYLPASNSDAITSSLFLPRRSCLNPQHRRNLKMQEGMSKEKVSISCLSLAVSVTPHRLPSRARLSTHGLLASGKRKLTLRF